MPPGINILSDHISHDLPYEDIPAAGMKSPKPYRRLLERTRTSYRKDDLTGALALGSLESMGLPYETYKLAFTPGLLSSVYQRPRQRQFPENLLPDVANVLNQEGGYLDLDSDGHWWAPSGQIRYSPGINDGPPQERAVVTESARFELQLLPFRLHQLVDVIVDRYYALRGSRAFT